MRIPWIFILPLAVIGAGLYSIPWKNAATRRRALWLLLLPAPALIMAACGPLGFLHRPYDAGTKALLMKLQDAGVAAAVIVSLILLAALKDLRRSSLLLGGVAIFATIAIAGVNQLIIDPTS